MSPKGNSMNLLNWLWLKLTGGSVLDDSYEAWDDREENGCIAFFPRSSIDQEASILSSKAKLLYRFRASSWEKAMTEHHKRQGWEPYEP